MIYEKMVSLYRLLYVGDISWNGGHYMTGFNTKSHKCRQPNVCHSSALFFYRRPMTFQQLFQYGDRFNIKILSGQYR